MNKFYSNVLSQAVMGVSDGANKKQFVPKVPYYYAFRRHAICAVNG